MIRENVRNGRLMRQHTLLHVLAAFGELSFSVIRRKIRINSSDSTFRESSKVLTFSLVYQYSPLPEKPSTCTDAIGGEAVDCVVHQETFTTWLSASASDEAETPRRCLLPQLW